MINKCGQPSFNKWRDRDFEKRSEASYLVSSLFILLVAKKQKVNIEKLWMWAYSVGEKRDNSINFEELNMINEDIVGWIVIEGTSINYLIVQGEGDGIYLYTTFLEQIIHQVPKQSSMGTI